MSKFSEDIIKLFEEFKRETGKYSDLALEGIKFEKKKIKDISDFPTVTKWEGDIDISLDEYEKLSKDKKNNYSPLISGSVENNQIVGYIEKSKIDEKYLSPENVISWSRINAKHFFIQKERVCRTEDAFVIKVKPFNNLKYVRYALMYVMQNSDFTWTNKAGKNKMKEVFIFIPKSIDEKYTSYEIQKAIADFIEFISLKSDDIVNLMEEITQKAEKGKENLLCKIFENLPNGEITDDIVNLFNEFKEEKGYQDLNLEDLEFRYIHIFEEIEGKLITVSSLNLKHNKVKELEKQYREFNYELEFYPVFSASSNPIGYLPEEFKLDKIVISNPENPDVSFATDGNASAGTNFIIHKGKYYINNTRKVIKFNENDKSFYTKYLYFALHDMKEKYNFNRNHKATSENLKAVIIPIPKSFDDYSSYQIQKIIAEFIEFVYDKFDYIKENAKEKAEKANKLKKLILKKMFY